MIVYVVSLLCLVPSCALPGTGSCPADADKVDYSEGGYRCICRNLGRVDTVEGNKVCVPPGPVQPAADMAATVPDASTDQGFTPVWVDIGNQPKHYYASPGRGGGANPLKKLCTRIAAACDVAISGNLSGGINFARCDAMGGFFAGRAIGARPSGGSASCASGSGTPLLLGCGGKIPATATNAGVLSCTGFDRYLTCTIDEGWQCPLDVLDTASNSDLDDGPICYCP